ncbi:unnamed protein product, partial [Staurois parvus]
MGPCTASSCCCQARNLPWAPVPPPHAAARSRVCLMGPCTASHCCCLHRHTLPCATFRSLTHCWWVPFCHRVLADYGPPIAAARPVICHGPPYRLLMLLPGNLSWVYRLLMLLPGPVCHGSLYGLPLLLSPSPHSAMCHFQVSSHCWWVPFCHRVL